MIEFILPSYSAMLQTFIGVSNLAPFADVFR